MSEKVETNEYERILLIVETPPCKNSPDGLFLSKLIHLLLKEKKKVYCFCMSSLDINYNFFEDINDNIELKIVKLHALYRKSPYSFIYKNGIRYAKNTLLHLIKKNKISKIWCDLKTDICINILNYTCQKAQASYTVQISSTLGEILNSSDSTDTFAVRTRSSFQNLIKNSFAYTAESEQLSQYLEDNYNINCNEIFNIDNMENSFYNVFHIAQPNAKKLNILQINNIDLLGRRFNGYDLLDVINSSTDCTANQLVTDKTSTNPHVIPIYKNDNQLHKEWQLLYHENRLLSVHSQLSLSSNAIKYNDYFQNADIVHYHLIHNTKLSLFSLIELCGSKPSVLTIHDPWIFTGRCVHPQECDKWKFGCENCEHLDTLFAFSQDNCNSLWKLKKEIYKHLDIDIIVSTPFIKKMLAESPLTNHFNNIHVLPFGLDLNKFTNSITKENARKFLNIPQNDIVLFFRAQQAMKGTEYILDALKLLDTDAHITLLTCNEEHLLDELKDKYTIIELGNIEDEDIIMCYNACDIFLMPSKGESFGLMAIEAMACSRPVIVFDNTALPYVTFAPECGVLVENKNSYKLMEAIKMLIQNPSERERRGILGRKLAEENYDIKVYNKKIMEVYYKAYERQKSKKSTKLDTNINYNLPDVKLLSKKLDFIYDKLFPIGGSSDKTDDNTWIINSDNKIDYSLLDVQNLINNFNNKVYAKTIKIVNSKRKSKLLLKFHEWHSLYVNDRPELLARIKKPLQKNKLLYIIFKIIYRTIKMIKHALIKIKRCIKK